MKKPSLPLRFRPYPRTWAGWRKLLHRLYRPELGGFMVPIQITEAFVQWASVRRGRKA